MNNPLASLEPTLVWSCFDAIRQIPRPSKQEGQISHFLQTWAKDQGFATALDETGNLVITVAASPGMESSPAVVLQGHMDMVCEKNSDVVHDFDTQGIEVLVDGDWVKARGTTLGADNGIGLAAAMAAATDPACVHPKLEILCTVDEETGLTGAKLLDPNLLTGRLLINLDTEEDGAIYIGCAGGADTTASLPIARRKGLLGSVPQRLAIRGLCGGHSGLNIIDNRGNAIKLMTRLLFASIEDGIELDLVSLDGGSKHNAIPRECFAVLRVDPGDLTRLDELIRRCRAEFEEEFGTIEPDLTIALEELDDTAELQQVLNVHARDRLLHTLDALPHGVLAMSREVPGLVETSSNLAVVATQNDAVSCVASHRSSIMSALFAVRHQVSSICHQAGATTTVDDAYPGWKPNPESPLVKRTAAVFTELFGSPPELKAIHAGLECGLLIEKVPDMDAVSIGPEIRNPHSPDEGVQISTVKRFYRLLTELLQQL